MRSIHASDFVGADLAKVFAVLNTADWTPRFNIAPTQTVIAVRQNGQREFAQLRWGLIPSWADDAEMAQPLRVGIHPRKRRSRLSGVEGDAVMAGRGVQQGEQRALPGYPFTFGGSAAPVAFPDQVLNARSAVGYQFIIRLRGGEIEPRRDRVRALRVVTLRTAGGEQRLNQFVEPQRPGPVGAGRDGRGYSSV